MKILFALLISAMSILVVASRFYPTVQTVTVLNNTYLSAAEVKQIANIKEGDPFFWIITWRARHLLESPWILKAQITRTYPDQVSIRVQERQPAVVFQGTAYAIDGVALPQVTAQQMTTLIPIDGWGINRLDEALELIKLLASEEPKMVSYSPAGFRVELANAEVITTPSVEALQSHWASFKYQQGARSFVYPWGVSTTHE